MRTNGAGTPSAVSLTFDQGLAICKRLFPLCDRGDEFSQRLQEEGFAAFVPRANFEMSFCASENDRRIHIKCEIEETKALICDPARAMPGRPGQIKHRYKSPFIEALERKRDIENGVREGELSKHFSLMEAWMRGQYDPCRKNEGSAKLRDLIGVESRRQEMYDATWRQCLAETERHASGIGATCGPSRSERCAFFIRVAEKYGSRLGFRYDKSKSSPLRPMVWKPLTEDWDLRWAVMDTTTFEHSPYTKDNRGAQSQFMPELFLCASDLRGNIVKTGRPGGFMTLRYQFVIPQFIVAYWHFYEPDEFETVIKAHLTLMGYMLPHIEAAIRETLRHD